MVFQNYPCKDIYEDDDYYHPEAYFMAHEKMGVRDRGRRSPVVNWKSAWYSSKWHAWHGYCIRLLKKNIGKKFDDIFKIFCKSYSGRELCGINPREEFFYMVDKHYNPHRLIYRHGANVYLDDEGIIRSYDDKKKSKEVSIITSYHGTNYSVDISILKKYPEVQDAMKTILGSRRFNYMVSSSHVSERLYGLLRNRMYDMHLRVVEKGESAHTTWEAFNKLFKATKICDTVVYQRGTKELRRYFSEKKQKDNKERKEQRKAKELENSGILYRIEAERKMANNLME